MKRFPHKKVFLVIHENDEGKQVKVLFNRKLSAYRFAANIRASYFINGAEKSVETKEIGRDELLAMRASRDEEALGKTQR